MPGWSKILSIAFLHLAVPFLLLGTSAAQTGTTAPPSSRPTSAPQPASQPAPVPLGKTIRTRIYTLQMPVGWRQLTPDEYLTLKAQLPADMSDKPPQPGVFEHWGPVDAWIREGFSGNLITVRINRQGEPVIDERAVEITKEEIRNLDARNDFRVETLGVQLDKLGAARHPAIKARMNVHSGPGALVSRADYFVVPSGGNGVSFQFRCFEGHQAKMAPIYQAVRNSMRFSKPPTGKTEQSDKITNALLIGAVVGLGLLLLRWFARQSRPE